MCFVIFIFIKIVEHYRGMETYRARPSQKLKVNLSMIAKKMSNLPFEAEFIRLNYTLLVLEVKLNR